MGKAGNRRYKTLDIVCSKFENTSILRCDFKLRLLNAHSNGTMISSESIVSD